MSLLRYMVVVFQKARVGYGPPVGAVRPVPAAAARGALHHAQPVVARLSIVKHLDVQRNAIAVKVLRNACLGACAAYAAQPRHVALEVVLRVATVFDKRVTCRRNRRNGNVCFVRSVAAEVNAVRRIVDTFQRAVGNGKFAEYIAVGRSYVTRRTVLVFNGGNP